MLGKVLKITEIGEKGIHKRVFKGKVIEVHEFTMLIQEENYATSISVYDLIQTEKYIVEEKTKEGLKRIMLDGIRDLRRV